MYRRGFLKGSVAAIAATVAFHDIRALSASSSATTEHTIEIKGFVFSPDVLTVRVGDRVTWVNKDIVPHTATASDGSWDSGELGPNESGEIIVTRAFTKDYFCKFHPSMTAILELA